VAKEATMTPTSSTPNVVAAPEEWEVKLAKSTASRLADAIPNRLPAKLTHELLQALAQEHLARLSQNLNHWSEYAPAFLAREITRRLEAEKLRKEEATVFLETNREQTLMFARTFFADYEDAEDSAAEADIKLWLGETAPKFYYRKLKQIILNKLKRRKKERELFEVAESFDGPKIRKTSDLWECVNVLQPGEEDAQEVTGMDDPLLHLVHKETVKEAIQEVKTNRKRRGVRSRAWWRNLVASEQVSRK
jgi:DNA-directed RNA polymerase specialized sigma24 family protein